MTDKSAHDPSKRILVLFEEGRRLTEQVLKENERLRSVNAQARAELSDLRNQYVKVDVAGMQQKLEHLDEEVRRLRAEIVQVERQNSDLVSLYVATQRLHSTLDYNEVVAIVKEIVINLVGSETFAIYVVAGEPTSLVVVGHEGMDGLLQMRVDLGTGVLGNCAKTGEVFIAGEHVPLHEPGEDPIACIPLKVEDTLLGVIAVHALLKQKPAFRPVDLELFDLLGGHAASALYVSSMYSVAERKRNTLEGLITLIKTGWQDGLRE